MPATIWSPSRTTAQSSGEKSSRSMLFRRQASKDWGSCCQWSANAVSYASWNATASARIESRDREPVRPLRRRRLLLELDPHVPETPDLLVALRSQQVVRARVENERRVLHARHASLGEALLELADDERADTAPKMRRVHVPVGLPVLRVQLDRPVADHGAVVLDEEPVFGRDVAPLVVQVVERVVRRAEQRHVERRDELDDRGRVAVGRGPKQERAHRAPRAARRGRSGSRSARARPHPRRAG